jgi:hypothetical protein
LRSWIWRGCFYCEDKSSNARKHRIPETESIPGFLPEM